MARRLPSDRLFDETRRDRQQKALRLPGTSPRRDHYIVTVDDRLFEDLALVCVQLAWLSVREDRGEEAL